MRNTSILRWEELVINAFPAIASELYDGWLLRYSNGYTYRGNCVNPLYAGEGTLVEKIIVCEARYAGRNLPCIFKMTPDAPAQLDALLEERGYCDAKHADIMAREITSDCFLKQPDVTVLCEFTDAWMIDFAVLNETTKEPDFSSVKRMLYAIPNPVYCGYVWQNGTMAGCAFGVQEQEYLGIFDVRVSEHCRRQGIATRICMEILRQAASQGASIAYLQVAFKNQAAISLYQKLGFAHQYTYWYRIQK